VEKLTMRAGGGAAVGVVTKCMDMKAALGIGLVASDIVRDLGRCQFRLLLENDGAADIYIPTKNADYYT
jgi:hypothetical protein